MDDSYTQERRKLATIPGSEWIYFRDGDLLLSDPWAGFPIRIVKSFLARGSMVLIAELTEEAPIDKASPPRRRVHYSELW